MFTRWIYNDTFPELETLRRQVDGLFRDFDVGVGPTGRRGRRSTGPRMNLIDTGSAFVIHGEVPGLSDEDIRIEATQSSITVAGERSSDAPEGYSVHRRERGNLEFARSFALPAKVDLERTTAVVNDGLLTITLPRRAEDQPRSIKLETS